MTPTDPVTFVLTVAVLMPVAALACYLPGPAGRLAPIPWKRSGLERAIRERDPGWQRARGLLRLSSSARAS